MGTVETHFNDGAAPEGAGAEFPGGGKDGTAQRGADSPLGVPSDAEKKGGENSPEKKEGAGLEAGGGLKKKEPTPKETASVYEGDLAGELGLTREALRDLRLQVLVMEADWITEKKRVYLTPTAAAYLREVAGAASAGSAEENATPGGTEAQGAALEVEELVVHRVPRNVRILEAKRADGSLVRVRVRDNGHFVMGMKFKARPGGEFPDVYVLEGRAPRYRGRW